MDPNIPPVWTPPESEGRDTSTVPLPIPAPQPGSSQLPTAPPAAEEPAPAGAPASPAAGGSWPAVSAWHPASSYTPYPYPSAQQGAQPGGYAGAGPQAQQETPQQGQGPYGYPPAYPPPYGQSGTYGQHYGGQYAGGPYAGGPYGGGPYAGGPGTPYGGGPNGPYDRAPWGGSGPSRPKSRPWVAAGLALALFVAAVLGFEGVSHYRAQQVPQSQSGRGGATNPFGSFFGGGSSANGGSLSALASKVAAKVDQGVVDINTTLGYQDGSAAGTGMVLTSSGEVLTNNHVVDQATAITVTIVGTGKTYSASVVGTDKVDDVALIQLKGASGLKTVTLADSSKVAVGADVIAIGNALGQGGAPSVVEGTVAALNQSITASDEVGASSERLTGLIQTTAALQPGDSGGPLANTEGQVIGMDTAASQSYRFQGASGASYAIPMNAALAIAHQMEAGQSSSSVHIGQPGFLGVAVQDGNGGAEVIQVEPNTPAASLGLNAAALGAPGDTITSVNGQSVGSAADLTALLGAHHPGDKVTLGWVDAAGQSHTASVTLTVGPVH